MKIGRFGKVLCFAPLVSCFLSLVCIIGSVSAISLNTRSFSLNLLTSNGSSYNWVGGILYNQDVQAQSIKKYEFWSSEFTPTGTKATIQFYTNIVGKSSTQHAYSLDFVNLDYMSILQCVHANSVKTIVSQSLNIYETDWDYQGAIRKTATFAGTVTIDGLDTGTTGQLYCTVGSDSFAFAVNTLSTTTGTWYFEANDMTIDFSTNISDALLNQQIGQNNTIISQNQQIIQSQQQANQLQQEQNDWLTSTDDPDVDAGSLVDTAGFLPPGPVDSILTLPITILQGIVDVFTGSYQCRSIVLPLPFVNQELPLPCIRPIMDEIGFSAVWDVVGVIIGAFIIFDTLKWLYAFVDTTLSFREDNSGIFGGL